MLLNEPSKVTMPVSMPVTFLGRALRQAGDYTKAIEVLRPILIEDFNAFRSAIELAISTVSLSGDFAQGASILVQAELLGIDDGRFIATLGGMQFLARNLDAARKTFAAGRKLPAEEQRAVYFKPVVQIGALPFGPVELSGTVEAFRNKVCPLTYEATMDIAAPQAKAAQALADVDDQISYWVNFTPSTPSTTARSCKWTSQRRTSTGRLRRLSSLM